MTLYAITPEVDADLALLAFVVILPLQSAGLLGGATGWSSSLTWMMWLPMLVFELAFAAWLLTKGVAASALGQQRPV